MTKRSKLKKWYPAIFTILYFIGAITCLFEDPIYSTITGLIILKILFIVMYVNYVKYNWYVTLTIGLIFIFFPYNITIVFIILYAYAMLKVTYYIQHRTLLTINLKAVVKSGNLKMISKYEKELRICDKIFFYNDKMKERAIAKKCITCGEIIDLPFPYCSDCKPNKK